jgi:hypothetical protein
LPGWDARRQLRRPARLRAGGCLQERRRRRHDWVEQEQENYRKGPWPLAILAHRVGCDTIEVADGLAAQDLPLKAAFGSEAERNATVTAIVSSNAAGCVLDLLSYWTCWRLRIAVDIVEDHAKHGDENRREDLWSLAATCALVTVSPAPPTRLFR